MTDTEKQNEQLKELLAEALELLDITRITAGLFTNQAYWKLKSKFDKIKGEKKWDKSMES